MHSIFSEDASGAEKWAKNDHTFFLKHPVANQLDTSPQPRMVPQTYPLNLANNRIEIAFMVLSLLVEIKAISAQPTELELDWAGQQQNNFYGLWHNWN